MKSSQVSEWKTQGVCSKRCFYWRFRLATWWASHPSSEKCTFIWPSLTLAFGDPVGETYAQWIHILYWYIPVVISIAVTYQSQSKEIIQTYTFTVYCLLMFTTKNVFLNEGLHLANVCSRACFFLPSTKSLVTNHCTAFCGFKIVVCLVS